MNLSDIIFFVVKYTENITFSHDRSITICFWSLQRELYSMDDGSHGRDPLVLPQQKKILGGQKNGNLVAKRILYFWPTLWEEAKFEYLWQNT